MEHSATCSRAVKPAPEASPVTGTYEILICKGACRFADSTRAFFRGHLVLADTILTIAGLPQAKRSYFELTSMFMDIEGPLNGCFTLRPVRAIRRESHGLPYLLAPGARTSVDLASLTHWARRAGDTVVFALYRSPDAIHNVIAHIANDRLEGHGGWSAVGVAEQEREGDIGADFVMGRRLGAADLARCMRDAPQLRLRSPPGSGAAPRN